MCRDHIRHQVGWVFNHKRIHRIYCKLNLNLRVNKRNRIVRVAPQALVAPSSTGKYSRLTSCTTTSAMAVPVHSFNVIDDCNREGLVNEVDFSFPATRVTRILDQLFEWRGVPAVIRSDNGPEFISKYFASWAKKRGIELLFTQPGNPQ